MAASLSLARRDEFLRHAAGDQAVGMVLAHQEAVGALDLRIAGIVGDAEDGVGIGLVRPEMRGADAAEFGRA